MNTAADDLDDGLAYDVEFSDSPLSDSETVDNKVLPEKTDAVTGSSSKKRKKNQGGLKDKKRTKMEQDIDRKRNLAKQDVETISEYLNDKIRRKYSDLSALELAEKYFSKNDVRLTQDFNDERNLTNLELFITSRFKNMLLPKQDDEVKYIAILLLLAIRACDTHRATKDLKNGLVKLITKNKLSADISVMLKTRSRVLCLTPARILKVLELDELSVSKDNVKIVIIDNSYLDKKQQNIWDLAEALDAVKELTSAGAKLYFY